MPPATCQGAPRRLDRHRAPYGILVRMPRACRTRAYRKTVSLLLALALFGVPGRAAEPDAIYLRFEVFGGPGLHFLTLQVSVDQSREPYSLVVDAETRRFADLFVDLRSRIEARGRISADVLFPEAIRAETHRRGIDLHTPVDYAGHSAGTARASARPA